MIDLDEHKYQSLLKREDIFIGDGCPNLATVDIWLDGNDVSLVATI